MSIAAADAALEVEVGLAAPESGPRVLAPFGRRACAVVANEPLGHYRLVAVADDEGPAPLAGQFYMLALERGWNDGTSERPFLGRAFSVCRTRGARREFLIDDVGPGTRCLRRARTDEAMLVVGPLGI